MTSLSLPRSPAGSAAHDGRPVPSRWTDLAVVGVPALVMAAVGGVGLTSRSLGFDEAATAAIASQHGAALWRAIAHDGGNMSAYYLVMHALIGWLGDGLLVLRLPSLLAGAVMAGAVALIGRRRGGPLRGLAAGLLAAVSLPVVYWSQTARAYAPMLAFLCLGLLAFLKLAGDRRDGVDGRGASPRGATVAYVVAMAFACYCSLVAVIVIPIQLVALARRPAALRRMLIALGALVLVCIPLGVLALARGSGQLFWVTRPSSRVDTQVLESITSAGLEPSFHRTATSYPLIVATLVGLGVALIAVLWRARRGEDVWAPALLLALFAVPVVLTFIVSLVGQPIFVPRNILITAPVAGLALVIAAPSRLPRPVLLVAVALLIAGRALQVAPAAGVSPEPWGLAAQHVLSAARSGDCAVFYPKDARSPFAWEVQARGASARRRAPRSILPVAPWSRLRADVEAYATLSPRALNARGRGCARVWLISSHEGQPDGPSASRRNRARWLHLAERLRRRFGSGRSRAFGYASTIHVQLFGAGRPAG